MWKRLLSAAHRAGFTRNETAVLLFLGAALLVGTGLRSLRGGTEVPPEDVRVALQRQDSLFKVAAEPSADAGTRGEEALLPANAGEPASVGTSRAPVEAASRELTGVIELNSAAPASLQRLPGVGPATAAKIVEHRNRSGAFRRPEDLLEVKGIGPKKFDRLRQFIIVK